MFAHSINFTYCGLLAFFLRTWKPVYKLNLHGVIGIRDGWGFGIILDKNFSDGIMGNISPQCDTQQINEEITHVYHLLRLEDAIFYILPPLARLITMMMMMMMIAITMNANNYLAFITDLILTRTL